MEIAAGVEDASRVAKETVYGSTSETVIHEITARKTGKSFQAKSTATSQSEKVVCLRCGKPNHTAKACKRKDLFCKFCSKKGHLDVVCLKKSKQAIRTVIHSPVQSVSDAEPLLQTLTFPSGQKFTFLVDSGARDSFCSKQIWLELGQPLLKSNQTIYTSASGDPIPVMGSFRIKATSEEPRHETQIEFNVTTVRDLNLMGRKALLDFKIDVTSLMRSKVCSVSKPLDINLHGACQQLCSDFKELFKPELGCLKDFELEIKFKAEAEPVFCKSRTVPLAVLEELNYTYEAGIKQGLWIPIQFNSWGTPVVPIRKQLQPGQHKAKLRVCGDCSVTVNPQLEPHRHPMPLPEDLMRKLGGGHYFSRIDLADSYHQIRLSPESQRRLALSTHKGVLLQTRLPFGITSAPGYFQEIMDKLTGDLEGVAVYLDDILVSGATATEHLNNLKSLLKRLQDNGLRCNLSKCRFAEPTVEYLGHTLSKDGIQMGRQVDAVAKMPAPTNVSTLKSFLGSVQFYSKFIPNLSTISEPLTRLTRKETEWQWTSREESSFQGLKSLLSKDVLLAHYDKTLPIGISCDASEVGIGVVLFQRYSDGKERPLFNVSKTLTATQRRYSQIQREALAIIYGLQKFHNYLYGRKFILVTGHKPLISLFNPKKGTPAMAANRLARWALTLSQYEYSIEYRKTTDHGNADALSRLPIGDDREFDSKEEKEDTSAVCLINTISQQLKPADHKTLAKESSKDPVLTTVMRYMKDGWPHSMAEEVHHFKKLADSLLTEGGCLLYGARIVIPRRIQSQILTLLHLGHFGINRMKQLARSVVYWQGIDKDIEHLCRSCTSCAEHQNNPPKVPNHPWMLPEKPWSRIHLDHAINFMGSNWLVIVDAYSKYPCIHPTNSVTASATINLLEEDFAHFGYPHSIVTDNAPSFISEEFQSWCKERGITHLTGAPYHPATNGAAERMVQTFKQSLRKSPHSPKKSITRLSDDVQTDAFGFRILTQWVTKWTSDQKQVGCSYPFSGSHCPEETNERELSNRNQITHECRKEFSRGYSMLCTVCGAQQNKATKMDSSYGY